ncbi:SDR family oxidoreductase [Nakamurella flavida]|uniref:SDR family oxidoreductase n=1 Tax=Nakamurella flavida TaxID=363630 RepID=A0A938YN11_9ACTN|nr:SDR family oxidoreductase [Nakamurella flavida]MBM9478269.1 SDR family oxidoreductase [Nakamurella flavida]MDP9777560.1 NAD(P)-dependent dehydrogenase (short-subunit alcohol dehydrogenase family) [Nakamurella flavida]
MTTPPGSTLVGPELFSLSGRTALVTGAGSGIGRRIAIGLAQAGADVACLDRVAAGVAETVSTIEGLGRRAIALTGDVTDPDDLAAATASTETELGDLTVAVNCAGIASATPAEDLDVADWNRTIAVNLTGVFLSCQAEARRMFAHGGGTIVNIASMSGVIANRGLKQAHYNSSKAGVIHLTKSLATEWVDRGVRVNAISPGYTATPMNTRPEMVDQMRVFESETPMQRSASVDEMVGPAVFLASPASSYCTGVDLLVDGGFTCW